MILSIAAAVMALGARPDSFVGADPAAYSRWLADKGLAADAHDAGAACEAATVQSRGGSLAGPPIMRAPPPGQFTSESVVEHLQVEGCGRKHLINFLVFRLTTGGWMGARLLDGASITSPQLQRDAMMSAAGAFAAGAARSGCAADQIRASMKLGPASLFGPRTANGGWAELWTATVCGNLVTIKMTFSPSPMGGTDFTAQQAQADGQPLPPKPQG